MSALDEKRVGNLLSLTRLKERCRDKKVFPRSPSWWCRLVLRNWLSPWWLKRCRFRDVVGVCECSSSRVSQGSTISTHRSKAKIGTNIMVAGVEMSERALDGNMPAWQAAQTKVEKEKFQNVSLKDLSFSCCSPSITLVVMNIDMLTTSHQRGKLMSCQEDLQDHVWLKGSGSASRYVHMSRATCR